MATELSKIKGGKPATFNFLGFTHDCGTSRRGYFTMGHRTSEQNRHRKIQGIKEWITQVKNRVTLKAWWPRLQAKLTGHYSYSGVSSQYTLPTTILLPSDKSGV